jgi:hypothetical protein
MELLCRLYLVLTFEILNCVAVWLASTFSLSLLGTSSEQTMIFQF